MVDEVNLEPLLVRLPDPEGAKVFLARLGERWPAACGTLQGNIGLLSEVLTLAAFSPFLAEVMLSNPQDIEWLGGQAAWLDRVKSTEQLSEDLARFTARPVIADPQKTLTDFKHREFLRIYLRDCLGIATLSEVTEELSNLADLIVGKALSIAETEQSRIHGYPLSRDEKGRVARAEMAVIALGKLGCRELNYSSDIDLFFIYSGQGETSGGAASVSRGSKTAINNKEFFTRIAERVVELIGGRGEGGRPVYRVDLRLRPYGRDGDLVWPFGNAAAYYRGPARVWERQALMRARVSAGSADVAARFVSSVESAVFRTEAVAQAVAEIDQMRRRARQNHAPGGGFNVKLGKGGIRDVEFITQALQLRFGARERWIRPAQMLIVLGRLSEKGYLSKSDRSTLSAAYTFLRTVEHRVQMDQGAQTHSTPTDPDQLRLLAQRCGYLGDAEPAEAFVRFLKSHTAAVVEIYDRVMSGQPHPSLDQNISHDEGGDSNRLIRRVSQRLAEVLSHRATGDSQVDADSLRVLIGRTLEGAINPARGLRNLGLWVEALATASDPRDWQVIFSDASSARSNSVVENLLTRLVLTLSCHYLAGVLLSRPRLAFGLASVDAEVPISSTAGFKSVFDREIDPLSSIADKSEALRRTWYPLLLAIGHRDIVSTFRSANEADSAADQMRRLRQSNLEQTALAEATLREAAQLALSSIGPKHVSDQDLPLAVLALGRLGHTGVDYASDLDLLIVYDEDTEWPKPLRSREPAQFAADFAAELVRILSSITREGTLYRVDLRLRPEGANGPIACGVSALESYISNRASAWEHSAYLKLREVACNLELGKLVRERTVAACFRAASQNADLREDLKQIRDRLQKEKAKNSPRDIKWGPGGMTDVYFITRYLQLRDAAYFPPEEGTQRLIQHLGSLGSLGAGQVDILYGGYLFLRRLDHWMRLLSDKPSSKLPSSMVVLDDMAKVLRLSGADEVIETFSAHALSIRQVFKEIF